MIKANKQKDKRREILFRISLGPQAFGPGKEACRTPGGKTLGGWLRSGVRLMIMCRQPKQKSS